MLLRIIYCLLCLPFFGLSQTGYNLSGYVIDQKTGESLIGAHIYNQTIKKGSSSNSSGYFVLDLSPGKNMIICSHVGYLIDTLRVQIKSDISHKFQLYLKNENLKEITLLLCLGFVK